MDNGQLLCQVSRSNERETVLQQPTALSALPTLTLNLHESINPCFTFKETEAQRANKLSKSSAN